MPGEHGLDSTCRCESCIGYRNDWTVALNKVAEQTVNLPRYGAGDWVMRSTPFGEYVKMTDVQDLMVRLKLAGLS